MKIRRFNESNGDVEEIAAILNIARDEGIVISLERFSGAENNLRKIVFNSPYTNSLSHDKFEVIMYDIIRRLYDTGHVFKYNVIYYLLFMGKS